MAGFSGGAALGPAIGGLLVDSIGITATYGTVGMLFLTLASFNFIFLDETRSLVGKSSAVESSQNSLQLTEIIERTGVIESFRSSILSWRELLNNSDKRVRDIALTNSVFWFTYSGTQMTLLPLYMVYPQFGMGAYEIGGCFAFMSFVSFFAAQPSAVIADRFGKVENIVAGCGLLSASMLALPHVTSLNYLIPILLPYALGSTALNATPNALMQDLTSVKSRAQALSLLRTAGDVGLLFGALTSGVVAQYTSIETALNMNGCTMVTLMIWFLARNHKNLSNTLRNQ
jgi:MFS family permease